MGGGAVTERGGDRDGRERSDRRERVGGPRLRGRDGRLAGRCLVSTRSGRRQKKGKSEEEKNERRRRKRRLQR